MISIDINSALETSTRAGIRLSSLTERSGDVESALDALKRGGSFTGWVDLPLSDAPAREAAAWAARLPTEIDRVVIMGIGGSSLGPLALYEAAHMPCLVAGSGPRPPARSLVFLDNSDPDTVDEVISELDPGRTMYVAITKSGSTAETASQLMMAWNRAHEALGEDAKDHFAFVTDPERGDLRTLARRLSVTSFDVPPDVGGRFSVLTPVGLVPAAAAGIDPVAMIEGARRAREACLNAPLMSNPAALLAACAHLMDAREGRNIHVVMAYSDRLARVGAWFRQLWAESLGKTDATGRAVGPTPLDARGATDQHSLLQLLMQGPPDKFVIFLDVRSRRHCVIPEQFDDLGSFSYLGGRTLGELIAAERRGTEASLARAGTPSVTFTLDDASPASVAALMYIMQVATAVAGSLYGIDPYDQPGVEEGKKLACGLLGRAGYEGKRTEAEAYDAARSPALVVEI